MPNQYNPVRQDMNKALRQIEIEEETRAEVSEREARRMMYRPVPHYVHLKLFPWAFTLIFGAAALVVWLAKLNHWWGIK